MPELNELISLLLVAVAIIAIIWLISRIIRKKGKPHKIFVISDTHFNHRNIISHCNRPFPNVKIMNQVMKNRWNVSVSNLDTVYFLGDFVVSKGSKFNVRKSIGYWKKQLHGHKIFIRGNHDWAMPWHSTRHHKKIYYKGVNFYLVHKLSDAPKRWDGWLIYGHIHNNYLDNSPFIDGKRKRINVSVEVINYRPVSLDYLISLNLPTIKYKRTIRDPTEYW